MTAIYRGSSDVMLWCGGVTRPAIFNWIVRHPGEVPEPDAEIVNEGITSVTRGWLPERRPEWEAFAAARKANPGSLSAGSARRNRKAAEMIYADMQAGTIDPATAARLLHELI